MVASLAKLKFTSPVQLLCWNVVLKLADGRTLVFNAKTGTGPWSVNAQQMRECGIVSSQTPQRHIDELVAIANRHLAVNQIHDSELRFFHNLLMTDAEKGSLSALNVTTVYGLIMDQLYQSTADDATVTNWHNWLESLKEYADELETRRNER